MGWRDGVAHNQKKEEKRKGKEGGKEGKKEGKKEGRKILSRRYIHKTEGNDRIGLPYNYKYIFFSIGKIL